MVIVAGAVVSMSLNHLVLSFLWQVLSLAFHLSPVITVAGAVDTNISGAVTSIDFLYF